MTEEIQFIRTNSARSVCHALCWNTLSTGKKNLSCQRSLTPFCVSLWIKEKYYILRGFPFTSFYRIFSFCKQVIINGTKALPFEIFTAQPNKVGAYSHVYSSSAAHICVRSMMSKTWGIALFKCWFFNASLLNPCLKDKPEFCLFRACQKHNTELTSRTVLRKTLVGTF